MQNDRCSETSNTPINTGKKEQCLNKPFSTFFKFRNGFTFASVAASKTDAAWIEGIKNKDIIPTYEIDTIADNETAKVEFEGRSTTHLIKDAVAGSVYGFRLSTCSHEALKSLESSGYTDIMRATSDNYFRCTINADGTVSPEDVTYFSVGTQKEATLTEVALTEVSIKYGAYEPSDLKADFNLASLEGILDIDFEVVSASSTEVKFKAIDSCSGSVMTSLEAANVQILDTDGDVVTTSLVSADSSGVYTFTGTGFTTGYTIGTVGVTEVLGDLYEGLTTLDI